ncbi:MAG: DUF4935 domain-containing protein [Anaerolineae bacterium]|nr:DUF4935 domain-containing protein [Anaerolineae bacterium]
MRSLFHGYYRPSDEEFAQLWQDCIFTFDTSALFRLYRYSHQTRQKLMSIMERVSDRIWLPFHVAHEYHVDRLIVISQQNKAPGKVKATLRDHYDKVEAALREYSARHADLDVDGLLKQLDRAVKKIEREIDTKSNAAPNWVHEDPIRDFLSSLFDGKVGNSFDDDRLRSIYEQGKERYERQVPPGYADAKDKNEDSRKYGDLVIWHQIIDHAKQLQKPIILVTDDAKVDWWREVEGQKIGPREELGTEFYRETGQSFYMYLPDQFLRYAAIHLAAEVENLETAIEEIEHVRQVDAIEGRFPVNDEYVSGAQQVVSGYFETGAERHIEPLSATMFLEAEQARKTLEELRRPLMEQAMRQVEAFRSPALEQAIRQAEAFNSPAMEQARQALLAQAEQARKLLEGVQRPLLEEARRQAEAFNNPIMEQSRRALLAEAEQTRKRLEAIQRPFLKEARRQAEAFNSPMMEQSRRAILAEAEQARKRLEAFQRPFLEEAGANIEDSTPGDDRSSDVEGTAPSRSDEEG